jgi:hypothetical protein
MRFHCPRHEPSRLTRSTAARAPWINILRRYGFPRLLMPSSFGLPPVEKAVRSDGASSTESLRDSQNVQPLPDSRQLSNWSAPGSELREASRDGWTVRKESV